MSRRKSKRSKFYARQRRERQLTPQAKQARAAWLDTMRRKLNTLSEFDALTALGRLVSNVTKDRNVTSP